MGKITVDLNICEDGKVKYRLDTNFATSSYFTDDVFWVDYPVDLSDVDESILITPAVTNFAPVAWTTGHTLEVEVIDSVLYDSLSIIKKGYERMLPNLRFNGAVSATNIVEADRGRQSGSSGMTFTGGVDSTATYFRRESEQPALIYVSRPGLGGREKWAWENVSAFADEQGLEAYRIRSNLKQIVNQDVLNALYKPKIGRPWWQGVQYGIGYMGVCAPLTNEVGIDRLYQASGFTSNPEFPTAQPYLIDPLEWSGTACELDAPDLTRQEKVALIANEVGPNFQIHVFSCTSHSYGGNCCECEKCRRTALGFMAAGIKPQHVGYQFDSEMITEIRESFDEEVALPGEKARVYRGIQGGIDDGSHPDVQWLKDVRVTEGADDNLFKKKKLLGVLPKPVDALVAKWYSETF